jgi:hypothetical protein
MPTYLLTWNPEESPGDGADLIRVASQITAGAHPCTPWSAGNTQTIQPNDRVFLLRQGRYAHGLIGSGTVLLGSHLGPHRDPVQAAQGQQSWRVEVQWDAVVPDFELPSTTLRNVILPASLLRVGSSGPEIDQNFCANLETAWAAHLASIQHRPNITVPAVAFQRQFAAFKLHIQAISGQPFSSFQEGRADEEEGYKGSLRNKALQLLNADLWTPVEVGNGNILGRLIAAVEINENNLVDWPNRYGNDRRSHRALINAAESPVARSRFEQWAFDFFQGRLENSTAFALFCQLAGPRYDLVAYFFFLKDWTRFMPIAPTTFDRAFKALEVDLSTSHQCSWQNYLRYNVTLSEIQRLLRDVACMPDARLLDAHSFCWMLVRLRTPEAPPLTVPPLPLPIGAVRPSLPPNRRNPADGDFQIVTDDDFAERDEQRRHLGRLAQDWALRSERRRLCELNHPNPVQAVQPVWDQPGRGYDILSCEQDGTPRHIEVKAARRSGQKISFYLSAHEHRTSQSLRNYLLYLVFNVASPTPEIRIVDGRDLTREFLEPTDYLASLNAGD